MKKQSSLNRFILIISLVHFFAFQQVAQEWKVPGDQKDEQAPFRFTPDHVKKGADLFLKNCQSCHGIPTRGNFINLTPPPGDPASEKFQKLTDGEMFYKISRGRGAMPQFRLILEEEDRWDLVSFIRSFHPGYIQPEPGSTHTRRLLPKPIIDIAVDSVSRKVLVAVSLKEGEGYTPVPDINVLFFVKRYFGNLFVGEGNSTDQYGRVEFIFPEGIPGDFTGRVTLLVRVGETERSGKSTKAIQVPLGTPTIWVPLTEPRSMWNIGAKAPIWLILSYILTVVGVFSTLLYIGFQIRKIYLIGSSTPNA